AQWVDRPDSAPWQPPGDADRNRLGSTPGNTRQMPLLRSSECEPAGGRLRARQDNRRVLICLARRLDKVRPTGPFPWVRAQRERAFFVCAVSEKGACDA